MASFRLSENLLKNLSEGAGYDAGGAATRGLANYQEQKKQRITDNQNQQTLDIQKQNAAATMENYKNQKENWATQNARISANDVITSTEAQRSHEANEAIEWAKLLADKNAATRELGTWNKEQTDRLDGYILAEQEASGSASQMTNLGKNMLKYDGSTGVVADVLLALQKVGGNQNSWSLMQTEYEGIINKLIVNGLPAGPASDKDIALIAKGFPTGTADVEEISDYLQMLGRAQAGEAERMAHKRRFFEENKHLNGWPDSWEAERVARSLALSKIDEDADAKQAEVDAENKAMLARVAARKAADNVDGSETTSTPSRPNSRTSMLERRQFGANRYEEGAGI